MTLTVVPADENEPTGDAYVDRLEAALRQEFRVRAYRATPEDVVLGERGPFCRVERCERPRDGKHGWCAMHLSAWRSSGLSAEKFAVVADVPPVVPSATRGAYRVEGLPEVLTLELQYGLQRVRDRAQAKLPPSLFNRAVAAVREHAEDATSLLDRPVTYWTSFCGDRPGRSSTTSTTSSSPSLNTAAMNGPKIGGTFAGWACTDRRPAGSSGSTRSASAGCARLVSAGSDTISAAT